MGNSRKNVSKRKRGANKRNPESGRVSLKQERQRQKMALREKLLKERAAANEGYLIIRSDEERPQPVYRNVERTQLSTEEMIEKDLKAISLNSIIRQAKTTSKGFDDAIVAYNELTARKEELDVQIKQCRAPRGADDTVKEEFKSKRDALKKEQKEVVRKADFAYEKAIALERSADEYSYIAALLTSSQEENYRSQPRINEKKIDLTKEEELELIERYLNGGKKKQKKAEVKAIDVVTEEIKTLKVLGGNRPAKKIESTPAPILEEKPVVKAEPKPVVKVESKSTVKVEPKTKMAVSPSKKLDSKKLGILFAIAAIVIILLVSLIKCSKDEAPVVSEPVPVVAVAEKQDDSAILAAEAEAKAAEEARIKAEAEAKAAEEARLKAEAEVKAAAEAKAAEEARLKAEAEAKAAEEARLKAEAEAKAAEEARLKAEAEAKAAEEARIQAELDSSIDWNIYGEISYGGYAADLVIGRWDSEIYLDRTVQMEDAELLISTVASKYDAYLDDVTYEIKDRVIYIDYPYTLEEADQLAIFDILNAETVKLVNSIKKVEEVDIEPSMVIEAIVEVAPVVEDVTLAEVPEEPKTPTEAEAKNLKITVVEPEKSKVEVKSSSTAYYYSYYSVSFGSFSVEFNLGPSSATIKYVRNSRSRNTLEDFFKHVFSGYEQYAKALDVEDKGNLIEVEYPKSLTVEEHEVVSEIFENEIEEYFDHLEELAEPAPEYKDSISFYGYTADFRIGTEDATVKYPSNIIYPSDLEDFAAFAFPKYSTYVDGVKFYFGEDTIEVDYPYVLTEADQKLVFDVVEKEIGEYLDYYLAKLETIEQPVVAEPVEQPIVAELVEQPEYNDSISFYGYSADFRIGTEDATVIYPSNIVYPSDLEDFAAFAFPKYSTYVDGVKFYFGEDTIFVDYPYVLTESEQKLVFDVVEKEVGEYLDYYIAKLEEDEEPVKEVIIEEPIEEIVVAEEPVEEIVVVEEPIEEIEVVEVPSSPVCPSNIEVCVASEKAKYESKFNLLLSGGFASGFNFETPVSLQYMSPKFGIGFDFQNIVSARYAGLGFRTDISAEVMPKNYAWSGISSPSAFFTSGDLWYSLNADLKIMAYFGNRNIDFYLGGGLGYSAIYDNGGSATTHTLGKIGPFSTAAYAAGNVGIRFMLNDNISLGAEVNYRFILPSKEHRVSADMTFGISF